MGSMRPSLKASAMLEALHTHTLPSPPVQRHKGTKASFFAATLEPHTPLTKRVAESLRKEVPHDWYSCALALADKHGPAGHWVLGCKNDAFP